MSYKHVHSRDNPLTKAHPLLELLEKIGFKFEIYVESPYKDKERVFYHTGDDNISAMMVYGNGVWAYEGRDVTFRRKMIVRTEQDLMKLLEGTRGEVYLRNYKLNVLNDLLHEPE